MATLVAVMSLGGKLKPAKVGQDVQFPRARNPHLPSEVVYKLRRRMQELVYSRTRLPSSGPVVGPFV